MTARELTPAQAAERRHEFWADDPDSPTDYPEHVLLGDPGYREEDDTWWVAHPAYTEADHLRVQTRLQERADTRTTPGARPPTGPPVDRATRLANLEQRHPDLRTALDNLTERDDDDDEGGGRPNPGDIIPDLPNIGGLSRP